MEALNPIYMAPSMTVFIKTTINVFIAAREIGAHEALFNF